MADRPRPALELLVLGCVVSLPLVAIAVINRNVDRPIAAVTVQDRAERPPAAAWARLIGDARAGNAEAQFMVGEGFRHGSAGDSEDVQDVTQALEWYRRAAQQGYPAAIYAIAQVYETGDGVASDLQQALPWYVRAAETGHIAAQIRLAELYTAGSIDDDDVLQDAPALYWYQQAALRGDRIAQERLSQLYFESGTPDYAQSFIWELIAKASGWEPEAQMSTVNLRELTLTEAIAMQFVATEHWNRIVDNVVGEQLQHGE